MNAKANVTCPNHATRMARPPKRPGSPAARGAIAWLRHAALLAGALQLAAAAKLDVKAPELFDRHLAATGGRPALSRIQTVVVKASAQERTETFEMEIRLKVPGQILMTAGTGGNVLVRQGRDAKAHCWRKDPREVRELTGKEAGELMNLTAGFFPRSVLFWGDQLARAVCEEEQAGDRTATAVGLKSDAGPFPRLLFDRVSGLLVGIGEVKLDDYRDVQGVRLPFEVRSGPQAVLKVREIRLNAPLADAQFEMPKDASAKTQEPLRPTEYATLASAAGQLEIVRRPKPVDFGRGAMLVLPNFDPGSPRHGQVDLRGFDLRGLDLDGRLVDLMHADFDSRTRWPARLPAGFEPARILERGRDPGLRVRELHARGIRGRGVGVGLIDQPLLVDHVEYRDRLCLYEEIHSVRDASAQMHGPATASILVGKTAGVAPEADLYYIAEQHGSYGPGQEFAWDFTWLAQSIDRLLEVNATLPAGRKMRVISISVGWAPEQKGYAEAMAAVRRATRDGVFVVSTAIEQTHRLAFHGLGRDALADPNDFARCVPGSWWAQLFRSGQRRYAPGERLLVPMDCRGVASPTGPNDYVFYWSAGWSWSVPWIAGLYALACEVQPDITPERFWAQAMKTGRTIPVTHAGETIPLGTIADPVALIESLGGHGAATAAR